MGWGVPKTCRPDGGNTAAQAHQQQKQLAMAQEPPQVLNSLKSPVALPPSAGQYSRRAAANLIGRLRANPQRVKETPLAALVFDEGRKSELIDLLCQHSGDLQQAGLTLQVHEEHSSSQAHRKRAVRWTKKQMEDAYGADAAQAMKHKEATGMVEDDENCPGRVYSPSPTCECGLRAAAGGIVYLMAQKEDEEASASSHRSFVTHNSLTTHPLR